MHGWVSPHLSTIHACTRRERIYLRAPSLVVLGAAVAETAAVMQPMMHGVGSAAPDDTHLMMHWLHAAFVPTSSPSTADGSAAFPTLITSAVVHTPVDSARRGLSKGGKLYTSICSAIGNSQTPPKEWQLGRSIKCNKSVLAAPHGQHGHEADETTRRCMKQQKRATWSWAGHLPPGCLRDAPAAGFICRIQSRE